MNIILPIIIFCSWFAIVIAPAGKLAIEDFKAGIPEDERRSVSILPRFPLMPLLFWGLAYGIDCFFSPWGAIAIIAIHSIALIWATLVMIKDHNILKKIKAEQGH